MPDREDAHPSDRVGAHTLGPHAVGQRVVVRRLLPGETGPTGGPAMTDLLGDLVWWPPPGTPESERQAVVLGEDGSRTRIPLALIVSGKPVPPRPSPRLRASARQTEQHTASLWPWLETEPLGEWLLRSDPQPVGRLLKRANSCLAMGDPGLPLTEAAAHVTAFYADRGREPMAQVEADSDAEETLRGLGWRELAGGEAELWLGGVAQARRRLVAPADAPGDPWLEESETLARAGLGSPGSPVAVGHAALDGDWLGLHGLTVAATRRRRGLGSLVLSELLEWGAERGARTAWLHVETDNEAARAMYAGLGMRPHHVCRYLVAPEGP